MKGRDTIQPPGWAQRFLEWYCNPDVLEDLQGDLLEYFHRNVKQKGLLRARIIYIFDVIKFMRAYTIRKPTASNNNNGILLNYYLTGFRNLKKYPLNTFLNITGLSIGLASFTIILLYVQYEYNFDRHDVNADRIFRVTLDVTSNATQEQVKLACTDAPLVENLRESYPEVEAVTGVFKVDQKVKVNNGRASFLEDNFFNTDTSYFQVFSHRWLEGDPVSALTPLYAIVLTKKLANKYFGNEKCLNKTLLINDNPYIVTGVIENPPRNSDLRYDALLSDVPTDWTFTYILFRPEAQAKDFESRLDSLLSENVTPALDDIGYEGNYKLEALTKAHFGEARFFDPPKGSMDILYIFTAVAFLILIISLVNYFNLTVAQSAKRQTEMGVRKIFGAMRNHIRMQYVIESLLICFISLIFSITLIALAGPVFLADLPVFHEFDSTNISFFIFTGVFSLLIAGVAGGYPAFQGSRINAIQNLKGKLTFGHSNNFRRGLIFIQCTASIGLISAASIVNDQMSVVLKNDPGFSRDQIVVVDIPQDTSVYGALPLLKNSIDQLTFVKNSSFAGENSTPGRAPYWDTYFIQPEKSQAVVRMLNYARVDENYFKTLGIDLLQGRTFTLADQDDQEEYVVVNEAMVSSMGWTDPLGQQIGYGLGKGKMATVIGVVKNFKFEGLHKKTEPLQFYLNYEGPKKLLINISATSFNTLQGLEDVWKKSIKGQPFEYRLLDDYFIDQLERENTTQQLITIFSWVAMIIACLGLFGMVSISIAQRMKETSLRKIFGADLFHILTLTWKEYIIIVFLSSFVGFPIIYFIMIQWLESFPVKTSIGISNYLKGLILFSSVMILTALYHVVRVKQVNIIDSIKSE